MSDFLASASVGIRSWGRLGLADSSLKRIIQSSGNPRILDLFSIRRKHGRRASHAEQPMFMNKRLNSGFIIKHAVRRHERGDMLGDREIVTKVILPLTASDLSRGGHSFCVQERGFELRFREFLDAGEDDDTYSLDLARLRELAKLPSFDPFLLATWFRGDERPVSPVYFDIPDKDVANMERHFAAEISEVVGRAFGIDLGGKDDERSRKFARAILLGEQDEGMDMFRRAMALSEEEFKDGLFGWKGLLYYTWQLDRNLLDLKQFLISINDLVVDGSSVSEREYLNEMRRWILDETGRRWRRLRGSTETYRKSLDEFAAGNSSAQLSSFLLEAPKRFMELGEDLAAIHHVASYWKFWRSRMDERISARDALDIFDGFMKSLQTMRQDCEVQMMAA